MKILSNYCGIDLLGEKDGTQFYTNFLLGKYVRP